MRVRSDAPVKTASIAMPPDSVLFLRAQKQQTHYHDERDHEQRLCVQAVHDFSLRPATTHSELATANL